MMKLNGLVSSRVGPLNDYAPITGFVFKARPLRSAMSAFAARSRLECTDQGHPRSRVCSSGPPLQAAAAETEQMLNGGVNLAKIKVGVFSAQQYVRDFLEEPLKAVFPRAKFIEAKLDEDSAALASGCSAVIAFVNDECGVEVLEVLASCGVRMLALRCAGYDRVDLKAAAALGIAVARVPTYSPHSVAEHAVALMFALNRNLHMAHGRALQGNYALNGLVGFEMWKKTVGVVGTGAIGTEACRILQGIGCNVLAHDLYPNDRVKELGIPYLPLEEMLPQCDIVSLHCPLLPTTRHLINKQRLEQFKHGAMLINVSRGGLVQTSALPNALESGQLGALGMDVYENEDDVFFVDHTQMGMKSRMRLWDRQFKSLLMYPQVIITPHSAFLTHEALNNIACTTIENLSNYFLGNSLESNEVKYKPSPEVK